MEVQNITNNKKLDLLDEFNKYNFQYSFAIYRLLDNNPNIMNMILPLTNLIYQKIENEIKLYISEPHMNNKTFEELKISNTHQLQNLLNREELKKYYEGIKECEEYYNNYKNSVVYFYEILGKESFLNSRYPIQRKENEITIKKEVDFDELYKKWTEYSIASGKVAVMYMAYCSSNTIIYLRNEEQFNSEVEEDKYISKIIEESFSSYKGINLEKEKEELFMLIKAFANRNKYYDSSYIS